MQKRWTISTYVWPGCITTYSSTNELLIALPLAPIVDITHFSMMYGTVFAKTQVNIAQCMRRMQRAIVLESDDTTSHNVGTFQLNTWHINKHSHEIVRPIKIRNLDINIQKISYLQDTDVNTEISGKFFWYRTRNASVLHPTLWKVF